MKKMRIFNHSILVTLQKNRKAEVREHKTSKWFDRKPRQAEVSEELSRWDE